MKILNSIKNGFLNIFSKFFKTKSKNKNEIKRQREAASKNSSFKKNKLTDLQECVLKILNHHSEFIKNSKIRAELFEKYELVTTEVGIRSIIKKLRDNHNSIIASNKGYLLTTNKKEIKKYIDSRKKEIIKEEKNINAIF